MTLEKIKDIPDKTAMERLVWVEEEKFTRKAFWHSKINISKRKMRIDIAKNQLELESQKKLKLPYLSG